MSQKILDENKIIFVDIGTHIGQEINSFTNYNYLLLKILKRVIKKIFKKKINFKKDFKYFSQLIKTHNQLRALLDHISLVTVEPNTRHFNNYVYKISSLVIPLAIDDRSKDINMIKFFIANENVLSQGNSIYKSKKNINEDNYFYVPAISSDILIKIIKNYSKNSDLKIILRLNCEGSEDDLIYKFKEEFGANLLGVLGSLKDVKIKGHYKYEDLLSYIEEKNIKFLPFGTDIESWLNAHKFILSCIRN